MRVGFDIGGTFTDVIVLGDDGRPYVAKVLSLLDTVGAEIAQCIRNSPNVEAVSGFVHGTTIASNAVIEGNCAPTALLTTRGFRDELEMRGQRRPNVYDVSWNRLPPLVPRQLRLEVDERVLGSGEIERALDIEQATATIKGLAEANVETVAVSLINSYLNPVHEQKLAELLNEFLPELTVCLSSEVHPEIREYERTSTTVINASLVPVVTRYLDGLEQDLRAFSERILIMQSNGGIMSSTRVRPPLDILHDT